MLIYLYNFIKLLLSADQMAHTAKRFYQVYGFTSCLINPLQIEYKSKKLVETIWRPQTSRSTLETLINDKSFKHENRLI